MNQLQNRIATMASAFANGVLETIRTSSIDEILSQVGGRASPALDLANEPATGGARAPRAGKTTGTGRLARRSPQDIEEVVTGIVALLGKNPDGLRAEAIREALGIDTKELPRPIKEALSSKRIRKTGDKRATVYFLVGKTAKKTVKKTVKAAKKPVRRSAKPAKTTGKTKTSSPATEKAAA